jgi:dihydroorotate dehydrogenase (fumarate)
MTDLATTYMGLTLSNPLIVSSCGLTKSVDGVKQAAEAGAGAIVLKSLFEEQIIAETDAMAARPENLAHTEAFEYLQGYGHAVGPQEYLQLVRQSKRAVSIPIIASINCVSADRWSEYAAKLADAGADALEINVGFLPNDVQIKATEVEDRYVQILEAVRRQVSLPVALKVGPFFSAFANLADRLGKHRMEGPPFTVGWCGPGESEAKMSWRAADALVLFNRFYRFDIDTEKLQLAGGNPYSTSAELHVPLRWISLLAGRLDSDLSATTGVHEGRDAAKLLLAGATTVQVCSALYRHGLDQLSVIRDQLVTWMDAQGFKQLDDFRGRLSQARSDQPADYERVQYIKALVGME